MMGIENRNLSPRSDNYFQMRRKDMASNGTSVKEDDEKKLIHSGQFMLSRVHDTSPGLDEDDEGIIPTVKEDIYDFRSAQKETCKSYSFTTTSQKQKTISIDSTLTKLFECMTLAYSGKLTSPKWKQFRGLQLTIKDKIRLNNLIWREWCMQYVYNKKPIICQFASPLSDDIHTRAEAIVLEGKYWKRRLDTVTSEYKKWRKYYKREMDSRRRSQVEEKDNYLLLDKVSDTSRINCTAATDLELNSTDFMDMDFSDALFSQLNQSSFSFPNPKELSGFGMSDLMQPGLIPLQPNLDDNIMDFDDLLQTSRSLQTPTNVVQFTGTVSGDTLTQPKFSSEIPQSDQVASTPQTKPASVSVDPARLLQPQVAEPMQQQVTSVIGQSNAVASNNAVSNLLNLLQTSPQTPDSSALLADIATLLLDSGPATQTSQMLIQQLQQQQRQQQQQQQQQQLFIQLQQQQQQQQQQATVQPTTTFFLPANQQVTLQTSPTPVVPIVSDMIITTDTPSAVTSSANSSTSASGNNRTMSSLQAALLAPTSKFKGKVQNKTTSAPVLSKLSTKLGNQKLSREAAASNKSDGFVVPMGTPVGSRAKQRAAPTPLLPKTSSPSSTTSSATPSQQNTYLAQLLTTGTYPGAVIKVEKEHTPPATTTLSLTPARPIEPAAVQSPVTSMLTQPSLAINLHQVPNLAQSVLIPSASPSPLPTTTSTGASDIFSLSQDSPVSTPFSAVSPGPADDTSRDSPITIANSPPDSFSVDSPRSRHNSGETKFKDTRRVSHISAEQKRRCNIKNGFDMLLTLIPALSQSPNAKVSKAAMLQKTAEYCKKLKAERAQMQNEADILKQEIESLNQAIGQCQSQLPATGVPVTRQRADRMNEMFDEYVKTRTLDNWRFWIFYNVIKSLFESYKNMVSTASMEELCRTSLAWLDQHCSLVSLRPTILNSLCHLSKTTSILSDPSRLPEQATEAVIKTSKLSKS